ncbi:hypothetical protein SDC9_88679 [bioreactor metagenome]|uniref:Uncharacterized protein n=1 Tax=bioreactor metagenome TaxID=1076179 RepID=A0A644ZMQ9_9ZZZZ
MPVLILVGDEKQIKRFRVDRFQLSKRQNLRHHRAAALLRRLQGDAVIALPFFFKILIGHDHAARGDHRNNGEHAKLRAFLHDHLHLARLRQALKQRDADGTLRLARARFTERADYRIRRDGLNRCVTFMPRSVAEGERVPRFHAEHAADVVRVVARDGCGPPLDVVAEKSAHVYASPMRAAAWQPSPRCAVPALR